MCVFLEKIIQVGDNIDTCWCTCGVFIVRCALDKDKEKGGARTVCFSDTVCGDRNHTSAHPEVFVQQREGHWALAPTVLSICGICDGAHLTNRTHVSFPFF